MPSSICRSSPATTKSPKRCGRSWLPIRCRQLLESEAEKSRARDRPAPTRGIVEPFKPRPLRASREESRRRSRTRGGQRQPRGPIQPNPSARKANDVAAYRSIFSFHLTTPLSGKGRPRSLVVWAVLARNAGAPTICGHLDDLAFSVHVNRHKRAQARLSVLIVQN